MAFRHAGPPVFGAVSEIMRVLTEWMEAVHARGELEGALASLLETVDGLRASVLRLRLDTLSQTMLARAGSGKPGGAGPELSFSQYLLGHGIGMARSGSVWYRSELDRDILQGDGSKSAGFSSDPRAREIAAAVLDPASLTSDILEIHFPRRLSKSEAQALETLVSVLSRTWRHRSIEVFPLASPDRQRPPTGTVATGAILSNFNPAVLSKAEFRVCTLLIRGLGAKAISARLGISESTVRSHLRSIYAKTKTQGQRDLMFHLLGAGTSGPGTAPILHDASGFGTTRIAERLRFVSAERGRPHPSDRI